MNMVIEINHSQVAAKPGDCPVILHISDLHFGIEQTPTEEQERKLVLNLLAEKILQFGTGWQPNYLCITGDIAHTSNTTEYDKARGWLLEFIKKLSIYISDVFICPGNHDANWETPQKSPKPKSASKVDDILSVPLPSHIEELFSNYTGFLEGLGVPQYYYSADGRKQSYMFGLREADHTIKILCCNSCFFSWDPKSKHKLLLGNKLLDFMQAEGLLECQPDYRKIRIALMHHSREQLDESEYYPDGSRPPGFNRVAEMSHLILMGHQHAKVNPWERSGYGAYYSCIGAAFYGIDHNNSSQLFRINQLERRYECKYLQWNSTRRQWLERADIETCWPFDRGATSQKELSNSKAIKLADDLWSYIRGHDFSEALRLWKVEQGWFSQNKSSIEPDLVERLDLLFREIELRSK